MKSNFYLNSKNVRKCKNQKIYKMSENTYSSFSDSSFTSLDDFDTLSTYLTSSDDPFLSPDLSQYPPQNPLQQAPERPIEDPQQANLN